MSDSAAVTEGLYRPLGRGAVDVTVMVGAPEGAGYRGWYVTEQDTVLADEPSSGEGPLAAVQASLDHLTGLAA